jgi:hypothetical protein
MDHREGLRSWLDVSAVRAASDIALGGIALVIGTAVIATIDGAPFSRLDRLNEWFFPALAACRTQVSIFVRADNGITHGDDWRIHGGCS